MCVCIGGRERIGQRKEFSKSSVALKERLYLARLRGLVNMYFVKQTAIAMGTPEIARKSKGKKKNRKIEQCYFVISRFEELFFSCLLQVLLLHIPVF